MNHEANLIEKFAEKIKTYILRKVIRDLRTIEDTLSGDDSDLKNAWEEICVQLQYQESFYWDVYDEQVETTIRHHLSALNNYEFHALWFQTYEGHEWLDTPKIVVAKEYYEQMSEEEKTLNTCEDDQNIPASYDAVIHYIKHALYAEAIEHSNPRIRKYLDQKMMD